MKKSIVTLCAMLLVFGSVFCHVGQTRASLLTNADFETGNMTGWSTFTSNGTLGSGYPQVVSFDVDGDGTSSYAAKFQVGTTSSGNWGGGGIYQNVFLDAGTVHISVDIAAGNYYTGQGGAALNALFKLYFDGNVVDTWDFGWVDKYATERSSLDYSGLLSEGIHEVRIEMLRKAPSGLAAHQFIDNVDVSLEPVPEPATMLLLGSGLVGVAGFRRRFRKN